MRGLVLLSGGLDSATCLEYAVSHCGAENVVALTICYGQRHDRELRSARAVAQHYGVRHIELDLTEVFRGAECTLLRDSQEDVPEGSYADQKQTENGVSTYVPFRNGVFLSICAAVALKEKCGVVFYGIHRDDVAGNAYPDCTKAFHENMARAINEGTGYKVNVIAPFINGTKADIVAYGKKAGVPYELTWSCYKGGEKPCGKCATCIDRAKAFAANNMEDKLWNF